MAKTDLTAQRLRELLHYDPETGAFTWLMRSGKTGVDRTGKRAGCARKDGYATICISGRYQLCHRLAWLYVHGAWPQHFIDHINGDPSDNRICNLRDVSQSVNRQNLRTGNRDSKSGLLGVSWVQKSMRWKATIAVNRKILFLGQFDAPEQAHEAYLAAKRRLHEGCTI